MFLARAQPAEHEAEISAYLGRAPSVGLLVAATYFEWTVCRAILLLSTAPNVVLRQRLEHVYGLERYKDFWSRELAERPRLTEVVRDWQAVARAFAMRNRLVHGRDRCTRRMASPHVSALLRAAADVRAVCESSGIDFTARLPVRRTRS